MDADEVITDTKQKGFVFKITITRIAYGRMRRLAPGVCGGPRRISTGTAPGVGFFRLVQSLYGGSRDPFQKGRRPFSKGRVIISTRETIYFSKVKRPFLALQLSFCEA